MSCKIEIAKCKQNVPSDQIEDVIRDLLKKKKMRENTLVLIPSAEHPDLNKFQEQFLSITLNNIPVSLNVFKF